MSFGLDPAQRSKLESDAEEVTTLLSREGIPRTLIKDALDMARQHGGFTIFAVVDALTRLSQRSSWSVIAWNSMPRSASFFRWRQQLEPVVRQFNFE